MLKLVPLLIPIPHQTELCKVIIYRTLLEDILRDHIIYLGCLLENDRGQQLYAGEDNPYWTIKTIILQ
jgi:hypothetical protein